jgi:hypothetical protein
VRRRRCRSFPSSRSSGLDTGMVNQGSDCGVVSSCGSDSGMGNPPRPWLRQSTAPGSSCHRSTAVSNRPAASFSGFGFAWARGGRDGRRSEDMYITFVGPGVRSNAMSARPDAMSAPDPPLSSVDVVDFLDHHVSPGCPAETANNHADPELAKALGTPLPWQGCGLHVCADSGSVPLTSFWVPNDMHTGSFRLVVAVRYWLAGRDGRPPDGWPVDARRWCSVMPGRPGLRRRRCLWTER